MDDHLRQQIATEAARLLLRGKEQDFTAARKRAARWLKRRKLRREDMPSNAEVQVQMYALSGVMAAERDPAVAWQLRHFAGQLLDLLEDLQPYAHGAVMNGCATPGAEIGISVLGSRDVVLPRLKAAGLSARTVPTASENTLWQLYLPQPFPTVIEGRSADVIPAGFTRAALQQVLETTPSAATEIPTDEHPDALSVFEMLIEPLGRVMLDPDFHPEGDALYHTLQVFELGLHERPYDEEFLLACLLHDAGLAINPKHPVLSVIDALGTLITPRTRTLIELRPVASEYLRTGECPRSLRKSEEFEDAVLLARLDRAARVPGAKVRSLAEAIELVRNLAEEWDDEDGN
jgi:hypothetical protein